MINYKSAVFPKFAEQRVIRKMSLSSVHLSYSSPMDTLVLLYFTESSFFVSFSCRICQCFCSSTIWFLRIQHFLLTSTNNFAHALTVSRMSSLSGCMNIGRVNIEFFPGWKKFKQWHISFVLGYLRMIFKK
jgi:hypothetical protein